MIISVQHAQENHFCAVAKMQRAGTAALSQDMSTQLDQSAQQVKTVSEKVDKNTEKQQKVMGKLGKIVGKKKG